MPKAIKGNAGRKPPEASARHSDIEDWFGTLVPYLQPIVKGLDESIRAVVPGLHYAVKWKRSFYGLPGLGWIIEIAPYDVSVNVVLFGGADFEPPPPHGTTDRTRYVKVTTLDEGHRPELHEWIEQAGRTPGWKLQRPRLSEHLGGDAAVAARATLDQLRRWTRVASTSPHLTRAVLAAEPCERFASC